MKMKNGWLSAFFGILQKVLTLIFGLIVPRLFIRTFGSEVNGLLSSIGTIYTYLALLEAGVGTTAIQALYGPVGREDKNEINEIMAAASTWYNKAGWLYLLGVVTLAVIYPLTAPVTIPKTQVALLVILSGLGGVINFWVQGKYQVLLNAEGKKYIMSIVSMVVYVASNVIKIICLRLNFDIILIHFCYFIVTLAQMLFYFFYMRIQYPWLKMAGKGKKSAISQSGSVLVQEIMRMICSNTDIVVLTYVARDLKAVSIYTVYLTIYGAVENIYSALFGSFHFALGQAYQNDRMNYDSKHRTYETLSMSGAFMLYSVAFFLTIPFLRVYTMGITDANYLDPVLPALFVFMHILSSAREASSRVITFAGHFRQMKWRSVLESAINLGTSVLLVKRIGIYGVLLGTIIAYLYRTNDIIIYANHVILKRSCWNTYQLWLQNIFVFIVLDAIFYYVPLNPTSYIEFFGLAIPVGIIVCLVYFVEAWITDRETGKQILNAIKGYLLRLH